MGKFIFSPFTYRQKVLIYEDYYHKSSAKNRPIFFTPGGEVNFLFLFLEKKNQQKLLKCI